VQATSYKFGDFEVDPARFELRRLGRQVKLERIPLELLILLIEKDGAVVPRQEIVERLWGKDVFVDTEHGINTAIRKIRTALREDADRPRFVQTVPGKGYRFIPEVRNGEEVAETLHAVEPALVAPEQRSRWTVVAAVALIVGAAGLFMLYQRRAMKAAEQIQAIAVLPLANLSGDVSQDYFADGMTDELITMLARNTSLRVTSRTSVMQHKAARRPLRDIAKELGVDAILEGSVERSGDRVHMTVQLIHARSDAHLWAESYDRNFEQVYSLPTEISETVAQKLNASHAKAKPQRYVNPEAHDAYLRGRYFWFAGIFDRAQESMKQAVKLQPDYAAAWSGLADAYIVLAVSGQAPPQQVKNDVEFACRKALELDDSLPEAHNSMAACYLFLEWNWKLADAESRRAIELNPQYAEAYHLRSYVLLAMNRSEESLKAQQRSTELDPFARPWALANNFLKRRQYDYAIKELMMRKDAKPKDAFTRFMLAKAYSGKGMLKEAMWELEEGFRLAQDERAAAEVKRTFERGGEKAVAQWFLDRDLSQAKKGYVSPAMLAADYADCGRKEETLAMLESAYREHSPMMVFLQYAPELDGVHDDPRYRKIVKDMNMDPAY
jgi:TolB-like protein/DNA-binding winged helix-turn-helix (wHTH) protein